MTDRRDSGMATAELAVVLPVLVLVIAAGLTAVSVMLAQLRCVDAARETARAAVRGEPAALVRSAGDRVAPSGAAIDVATEGDEVRVTVSARAGKAGGLLPTFQVRATAVAVREPESSGVP
jgi:Flp pilus assembly protein TadG